MDRNSHFFKAYICFTDCCWKVKVAFTTNHLNGAYKLHKYIFGYYIMEPGLINGRSHYTSVHGDGAFALAYCGDSWWLQASEVVRHRPHMSVSGAARGHTLPSQEQFITS